MAGPSIQLPDTSTQKIVTATAARTPGIITAIRDSLTEVRIDSNFDGRSDIEEYYDHGVLVRRESDRNFDDRVDLVEEFDTATHERVRSVADLDFDGTADLLLLFQDGRPVFSKAVRSLDLDPRSSGRRGDHATRFVEHRSADERLAPLADPFRGDTAVRGAHSIEGTSEGIGLSTSGGLPRPYVDVVGFLPPSARLQFHHDRRGAVAPPFVRSPRGPPLT